jgi:putative heme-binding domain-containing protein
LQAVVACTYVGKAEAMEVASAATDFPTDKFLSYALNQAVFALKPYWLPAFKSGKLRLDNKAPRLDLLVRADATPDTLQAVRDLLESDQSDSATREAYLRILADHGNATDLASLLMLSEASLQTRLLPELATAARVRRLRPAGDLVASLRPLIGSKTVELRAEAFRLAGIWKLETFHSLIEAVALDAGADADSRRAAIDALTSFGGDSNQNTLALLASGGAPWVQGKAIASLTGFNLEVAAIKAAALLHGASPASLSPPERLSDRTEPPDSAFGEIFSAFLQRQGGATALSNALRANPPTKPAAAAGLRLLNAGGRREEQLARVLTEAAGFGNTVQRLTPEDFVAFAAEVRARGNSKRGGDVFLRPELGCTACHAVNGQGGRIGPDLSALGTAQPVEFIIGAILDPQKEIKEGFMSISVLMKDGEEYQGYQVGETGEELVLRDVLQNKEVRLRRDAIKEKKQNGSVMPGGLSDTMTRAEFRDLVRFLSELGRPK